MSTLIYLLIILGCIIASGFFSSSETALLKLRPEQLENDLKAAKKPGVIAVKNLLGSPSRLLVTILLGNNIVNIVAASFASALAVQYLGEEAGLAASATTMTILILIFSEILPKAVAARDPKKVAYWVALPLYFIHHLLRPFHLLFDKIIDPIVKRITKGENKASDSMEEILILAKQAQQHRIDGSPISIIAGAAEASEMTVSEVMTPRAEILAFSDQLTVQQVLKKMASENHTRVPIYAKNLNDIQGMVHIKDLVKLSLDEKTDLKESIRPVARVPMRKPILPLLSEMQKSFMHMAIVKDEFGQTSGIVTQEDILEEIVGEIRDEFDQDELLTINKFDDNTYEVLGKIPVLDFNRETGWEIESERGDTLAGLVFNALGRFAKENDSMHSGQYKLTVIEVNGGRITKLKVQKLENVS